ncbi:hypothetical protein V501_07110 [Pseudogymnoascus sp. VKM F-4519 (FW-2642)]|nr:hypothetical protein V501_07110 [Pseudogymnoascus sp. VKM F-4519 (FW-2642)]
MLYRLQPPALRREGVRDITITPHLLSARHYRICRTAVVSGFPVITMENDISHKQVRVAPRRLTHHAHRACQANMAHASFPGRGYASLPAPPPASSRHSSPLGSSPACPRRARADIKLRQITLRLNCGRNRQTPRGAMEGGAGELEDTKWDEYSAYPTLVHYH